MIVSRSRLIFNITFILLYIGLYIATYPAAYSSIFIFFAVTGVFVTVGFFTKNKGKTKWGLFAAAFILFFIIMLVTGI